MMGTCKEARKLEPLTSLSLAGCTGVLTDTLRSICAALPMAASSHRQGGMDCFQTFQAELTCKNILHAAGSLDGVVFEFRLVGFLVFDGFHQLSSDHVFDREPDAFRVRYMTFLAWAYRRSNSGASAPSRTSLLSVK